MRLVRETGTGEVICQRAVQDEIRRIMFLHTPTSSGGTGIILVKRDSPAARLLPHSSSILVSSPLVICSSRRFPPGRCWGGISSGYT